MGDASFDTAPIEGDPGMMGAPSDMGGDPNAMGGDTAMGGDPGMGGEPNAMEGDPGMIGGPDDMGGDQNGGIGDDTMSIINQLSDTDKEAVRSYAESMLSRDEKQDGNEENGQPMMEQVIFTKGQLNKIQENFGPTQDELSGDKKDRNKPLSKKNEKTTSRKSPFNPPTFS